MYKCKKKQKTKNTEHTLLDRKRSPWQKAVTSFLRFLAYWRHPRTISINWRKWDIAILLTWMIWWKKALRIASPFLIVVISDLFSDDHCFASQIEHQEFEETGEGVDGVGEQNKFVRRMCPVNESHRAMLFDSTQKMYTAG